MRVPWTVASVLLVVTMSVHNVAAAGKRGGRIAATRHNLTARGAGAVTVADTTGMCKFCHTPHSSSPMSPLWNRKKKGTYYKTYKSSTLTARVGQPSGESRLCLSCHDGTIALAQTQNSRNAPAGTVHLSMRDGVNLGTDLSDDHPISFRYTSSLAIRNSDLRDPAGLPKELRLDKQRLLQCTTCHDPHQNSFGSFLVMDNTESRLCRSCHSFEKWSFSSHAVSTASLGKSSRDRWENIKAGTVRDAACEACHRPHTAGGRQRLLRHGAEEDNCLSCHDGTVAKTNILTELSRISSHPVSHTIGVHDPMEKPRTMQKHVECADCHNPHQVASSPKARAPFIKPEMTGVSGFNGNTIVERALYEYQVCYKCHATRMTMRFPVVRRVIVNTDVSDEFSHRNASFHPVETRGKNTDVPSLLHPLKTISMIYCTDCHGSSGVAARGPHGSRNRPMLVRNYTTRDRTAESPDAYALCYGCHERSSILSDRSFKEHRRHIVKEQAPCSACHDAHGVSRSQVRSREGTHLINFDRDIVSPSKTTNKGPTFEDRGTRWGSCTHNCHGEEHNNREYRN